MIRILFGAFFIFKSSGTGEKERVTMEFVTGVTQRDEWSIAELAGAPEHSRGKIRGAVHNIRTWGRFPS